MIRAIVSFLRTVAIVITLVCLLSAIAMKTISQLSAENFELRRQVEDTQTGSQTMLCDLHIELFPVFGIDLLTYEIPMAIPSDGGLDDYGSGEILPILHFEESFFASCYVTAR